MTTKLTPQEIKEGNYAVELDTPRAVRKFNMIFDQKEVVEFTSMLSEKTIYCKHWAEENGRWMGILRERALEMGKGIVDIELMVEVDRRLIPKPKHRVGDLVVASKYMNGMTELEERKFTNEGYQNEIVGATHSKYNNTWDYQLGGRSGIFATEEDIIYNLTREDN